MTEPRSYYGRPVLKEPSWTWEIPTYFFTGGLAGASSALSLAAKLAGHPRLARTALYVGAAADAVSPLLLVSDLGRPERFHHMFRVAKVTSPMNVGAWILLVSGGASNTAALLELAGRLKPVKIAAEVVAALAGPPLATYTGVLVADTAIPVWHDARRELPWLFGASACASAGAAACMLLDPAEAGPARRLVVGAAAAEGAVMNAMELRLGETGEVYRRGAAGKLAWAARSLVGAGTLLLARRGGRSRRAAAAGGALVCAGELCLRWSVYKAGFQSARDPKYTVAPQRARLQSAPSDSRRWKRQKGVNMQFQSIDDVFVEQIEDLLSAEKQLVQALPKMAQAAADPKLKEAFTEHLGETRDHVSRLEEIFGQLGRRPAGEECKAMKGLIAEGTEIISATGDPAAKDAALIAAAQRVEHYEIAGYGTAKTLAGQLDRGDAKDLLEQTLDEESNADKLLTKIATGGLMKSGVNQRAS